MIGVWVKGLALVLAGYMLTGCGGGGGSGGFIPVSAGNLANTTIFSANQPNATRPLTLVNVNGSGNSVFFQNATLRYSDDRIVSSSLAGTVQYSTSNTSYDYQVQLSGGGVAYLKGGAQGANHVFVFSSGGISGAGGEPTATMPTTVSSAIYRGRGEAIVTDASATRSLAGNYTGTANFNTRRYDMSISGGAGGTVRIDNATISGARLTGGNLTLSGSYSNPPSNDGAVNHSAQFYGPDAAEIGGGFVLDRTGAPDPIQIIGVYTGVR